MNKALGILVACLGVALILLYSPLPSGNVKNGFLLGIAFLTLAGFLLGRSRETSS